MKQATTLGQYAALVILANSHRAGPKPLADLTVCELLEAEEQIVARQRECPLLSNSWRNWDAKLDKILGELLNRAHNLENMH